MAEPKIVFCSNNHIYDAAINDECPYCKKIASEQRELSDSVNGVSRKRNVFESSLGILDEDYTELISGKDNAEEYTELISRNEDLEYTELIHRSNELQEDAAELISHENEEEYTELIRHDQPVKLVESGDVKETTRQVEIDLIDETVGKSNKNLDNNGRVLGWLVLKNGTRAGHSIEICQETKYIYELQGTCITSSESTDEMRLLAKIENDDALSIIPEKDVVLTVNGMEKKVYKFPRAYDELEIDVYHISYIEIMAHFLKWED